VEETWTDNSLEQSFCGLRVGNVALLSSAIRFRVMIYRAEAASGASGLSHAVIPPGREVHFPCPAGDPKEFTNSTALDIAQKPRFSSKYRVASRLLLVKPAPVGSAVQSVSNTHE
jgi:hypothetical protein